MSLPCETRGPPILSCHDPRVTKRNVSASCSKETQTQKQSPYAEQEMRRGGGGGVALGIKASARPFFLLPTGDTSRAATHVATRVALARQSQSFDKSIELPLLNREERARFRRWRVLRAALCSFSSFSFLAQLFCVSCYCAVFKWRKS